MIALFVNPVNGRRENPLTINSFHLDQILPDIESRERIDGLILSAESRMAAAPK